MRQGDRAAIVYLSSGIVRLSRSLSDGRICVLGFGVPGDLIGLTFNIANGYSVTALSEVEVMKLDSSRFKQLVEKVPSVLKTLFHQSLEDLNVAMEHAAFLARATAEERVAAFLLQYKQRLRSEDNEPDDIHLPMSRQDIADYLGLSEETVSRMLTSMDRKGLLSVYGSRVRVLDRSALVAISSI
jgi:CRP/FNR family transcriptional regulator